MPNKSYPCKDTLWAHCGALGEALRRASEAERMVEELEKDNAALQLEVKRWFAYIDRYEIYSSDEEAFEITLKATLHKAGVKGF
jgi:hypothetical protein